VLAGTGLFALTLARARLVGIGIDRAWTSVAAFERAYGEALRAAGAVPPPFEPGRDVSGAAGGTVLPAAAGYREGVVVLDFKSLYPSVMRTFCIDPMANERARSSGLLPGGEGPPGEVPSSDIVAPNGARFAREPDGVRWPLTGLVDTYFARREEAMARKDATGSYVYKILMNSFYGVLGTASCRYARTELAGAITSFGKLVLLRAKACIEQDGSTVLYGDTDSLFVATGLGPDAPYAAYRERGDALCALVNTELAAMAESEYGVVSRLELRFDKAYARFIIPPLRMSEDDAGGSASVSGDDGEPVAARGRAKGYAGLLRAPDGDRIDVKGMEAVRSDWTPLAREFQVRLLTLAFSGSHEAELGEYLASVLDALKAGELDARLVYTRSLRRSESAYVKSTPPHVKAARLAGLVGRGRVSYVIGDSGPAPVDPDTYGLSGPGEPRPEYRHYIDKQLLPIARSLAASGLPVPLGAFGLAKTQGELF
jgi:DNA polymerase-2